MRNKQRDVLPKYGVWLHCPNMGFYLHPDMVKEKSLTQKLRFFLLYTRHHDSAASVSLASWLGCLVGNESLTHLYWRKSQNTYSLGKSMVIWSWQRAPWPGHFVFCSLNHCNKVLSWWPFPKSFEIRSKKLIRNEQTDECNGFQGSSRFTQRNRVAYFAVPWFYSGLDISCLLYKGAYGCAQKLYLGVQTTG